MASSYRSGCVQGVEGDSLIGWGTAVVVTCKEMTLCEETFEAVGGCEIMRLKDLTTTRSQEVMRPSFLTTKSHPEHRFHILNANNETLSTGASNRFPILVSSEL